MWPMGYETTIRRRVAELVKKHGGLRAAARAIMLTPQYLYRLGTGEKENPSGEVLRKLGLVRHVTYRNTPSAGVPE